MRARCRPFPPHRAWWARVAVLVAVLVSTACTATDPGTTGAASEEVALVVVGDSLTAGSVALEDGEVQGERSWIPAAVGDPLALEGGWAVPGATTADMRGGVTRVAGDVLVLMAGTNDLSAGRDWTASRDDLLSITRTLRIDEVVVSSIPPFAPRPEAAVAYNEQLQQLALEQGWTFVDPWAPFSRDGAWAEGATADGVHPTQEVADEAGRTIRAAVLARVGGG